MGEKGAGKKVRRGSTKETRKGHKEKGEQMDTDGGKKSQEKKVQERKKKS